MKNCIYFIFNLFFFLQIGKDPCYLFTYLKYTVRLKYITNPNYSSVRGAGSWKVWALAVQHRGSPALPPHLLPGPQVHLQHYLLICCQDHRYTSSTTSLSAARTTGTSSRGSYIYFPKKKLLYPTSLFFIIIFFVQSTDQIGGNYIFFFLLTHYFLFSPS